MERSSIERSRTELRKTGWSMMKRAAACILALALALALGAGLLGGCAAERGTQAQAPQDKEAPSQEVAAEGQPEGGGMVLTDMVGREVRLDGPATRTVALTAADVEILFAIGAGDILVGRGEFCNYPPEALEIPALTSGNETNVEQIIALEPQVVVMGKMAQDEAQMQQIEDAGIAVFVTDAQEIAEVYTCIDLLGQLTGKEQAAIEVVSDMETTFSDLQAKAAATGGEQKSIYFEVSPLEFGLWTTGTGTFMNEVAELLGMRNIFADVSGWAEVSEEQVLERNPDYILTVGMYFGDGPTPIESILSRPGWDSIAAIKNEAILNLTDDELSRPGPRLALGAQRLYDFVYEGKR